MDVHNCANCLKIRVDATDYIKGVNSPIVFKANTTNWNPYLKFFESQKLQFETDGCVLFTAQESFDGQMEYLISSGQISASLLSLFNQLGYMDTNSLDGKAHFHSSARYLQIMTGNGQNGNSLQDPWNVMRTYGVLPWTDLPYDSTITLEEYFTTITPAQTAKAAQFLAAIGGKNAIQYHWVNASGNTNIPSMVNALPQAPLCLGTTVCEPWDQLNPPVCTELNAAHSTLAYEILPNDNVYILDHYVPYDKILNAGYPICYVVQGILSPIPVPSIVLPPIPVLPTNPTAQQELATLDLIASWLKTFLSAIQ